MASDNLIVKARTTINAPVDTVWNALIDPAMIKKYMFDTNVESDWQEGSKITWSGEYRGKAYVDKGEILTLQPTKKLAYTHYSPLTGQEDKPENYHRVEITLESEGDETEVTLTQDKNTSEKEKEHSEMTWNMMLNNMKKLLEKETGK